MNSNKLVYATIEKQQQQQQEQQEEEQHEEQEEQERLITTISSLSPPKTMSSNTKLSSSEKGDFFDYISSYFSSRNNNNSSTTYRRLLSTSQDNYDTYIDKTFVSSEKGDDFNNLEESNNNNVMKQEKEKVYYSRWYVLGICSLLAFGSGAAYDYGLYSDALKENLDYSETESSLVDSFGNAGLFSMILSGLLLEKVGPKNNVLIGGLLAFIGYFILWAISLTYLPSNIATTCITMYVACFGLSFFSITITTVTVRNFPQRDRGKAVGIIKALLGLGISVNSQFYSTFFSNLNYLFGLAIVLPVASLICAQVINYMPTCREIEYSDEEYTYYYENDGINEKIEKNEEVKKNNQEKLTTMEEKPKEKSTSFQKEDETEKGLNTTNNNTSSSSSTSMYGAFSNLEQVKSTTTSAITAATTTTIPTTDNNIISSENPTEANMIDEELGYSEKTNSLDGSQSYFTNDTKQSEISNFTKGKFNLSKSWTKRRINFKNWFFLIAGTALYLVFAVYLDEGILNEGDDDDSNMNFSLKTFWKYFLFLPTFLCILYGAFVLPNHYGSIRRTYNYPLVTEAKTSSKEKDSGIKKNIEDKKTKEETPRNYESCDHIHIKASEKTQCEDCCVVKTPLNIVKNFCDDLASTDPTSSLELGKEIPELYSSGTTYPNNTDLMRVEKSEDNVYNKLYSFGESRANDDNSQKKQDRFNQISSITAHQTTVSSMTKLNTFYPNINLCQMVFTTEFWLIFTIFMITMGTCLTVINNIASIIDSFSSTEGTVVALLIFGILETLGRLSVSFSDLFRNFVLVRVAFLYFTIITIFICSIVLAFANIYTLNIAIYLVAYLYGFLYSSMIALVADLFGLTHFGSNLGLALFAPIIGSFLCSTGLVSLFYADDCSDSACFQNVFLTEAALLIVASFLCLVLLRNIMCRAQINSVVDIFQLNK